MTPNHQCIRSYALPFFCILKYNFLSVFPYYTVYYNYCTLQEDTFLTAKKIKEKEIKEAPFAGCNYLDTTLGLYIEVKVKVLLTRAKTSVCREH